MRNLFGAPGDDRPLVALSLLLCGIVVIALQDALVKLIADQTSYWQFQTLRAMGNIIVALLLAIASGGLRLLLPRRFGAVYLRATVMTLCMFCFFSAAPFLSLSQMAAGLYTYPLFVTLLAGPVLGERVGPWRIGALLLGSAGALVILAPWRAGFSWMQLLPVLAGFFFALNVMLIRGACRHENTLAMAFAVALMFLACGVIGGTTLSLFPLSEALQQTVPYVAIGWPELTLAVIGIGAVTSVLNLSGNLFMSRAYQTAESSWLAPVDFSYLLFAALWGRVLFDTWPTAHAVAGMALIATAGVLTSLRERVRRRAAATETTDDSPV
ncbi:MAG: drug/metabolite transporter (DMT)-like permease [Gammaproteobacteria bacterium]|jgi:drug/metabolite transporter (DMT)-like permease